MKKILIADDEKPMAHALELKLKHEGFEALAVFNGQQALDEIAKTKYDLILLDLMMPEVDGFQVLDTLKQKKISTPVIVLSNLGQESDAEKAKEHGAKDYFIKSDTPLADIVRNVKKVLHGTE